MREVIDLSDRRHHRAPAEVPLFPLQGAESDPEARRAALYDMLRILGRTVRIGEMGVQDQTEFALAALKVLGPDWKISRSR